VAQRRPVLWLSRICLSFRDGRRSIKIERTVKEFTGPEEVRVPRISDFYGIAIYMYYRDHAPRHFHAIYGESEATISIETAEMLEGRLPRRAR
jgi:hypothetical protein